MNAELGTAYSILERNAASMSAEEKTKFAQVLFRSNVRILKEMPFVSVTSGVSLDSSDYDDIEKCLADMLEDLGLYQFPIDCFTVADRLGIECTLYFRLPYILWCIITEMSTDGISLMGQNGTYIIYYNDALDYHRIMFTIWHEIGHIQLGAHRKSNAQRGMLFTYGSRSRPLCPCRSSARSIWAVRASGHSQPFPRAIVVLLYDYLRQSIIGHCIRIIRCVNRQYRQ